MYGHPTAKPPPPVYRRRMIRAVNAALLDLELPEEILTFIDALSRRLTE